MKKTWLLSVASLALGAALNAKADVIVFNDLTESPFVTINGTTITGDGGRVSNFSSTLGGELISFTLADPSGRVRTTLAGALYTNVFDPTGGLSDRWIASLVLSGPLAGVAYNVTFASDGEGGAFPGLPAIPPGAVTSGPIIEDGTVQQVGTVQTGSTDFDFLYVQSNVEPGGTVPEPSSIVLGVSTLGVLLVFCRRRSTVTSSPKH
jgi:hypothetical protein